MRDTELRWARTDDHDERVERPLWFRVAVLLVSAVPIAIAIHFIVTRS